MRSEYNEIVTKDNDNPFDTVTSLVWSPYSTNSNSTNTDLAFLCTSWDGYIRYYQINSRVDQIKKVWEMFLQHPVICCDFGPIGIALAGLVSGDIAAINLQTNDIVAIGRHQAPICGIYWIKEFNIFMTLAQDQLIKIWSLQQNNNSFQQAQFQLPYKTYVCAYDFPYILIGSQQSTVCFIDMQKLPNLLIPSTYFGVQLKIFSKFTSASIAGSTRKAVMGTADGKITLFSFSQSTVNGYRINNPSVKSYHKKNSYYKDSQINTVCIGIHKYEAFMVIGGGEDISVYNYSKQIKSKGVVDSNFKGSFTCARLSPNNKYVVFAQGSDWMRGLNELQNIKKPRICLSKFTDAQLNQFVQ